MIKQSFFTICLLLTTTVIFSQELDLIRSNRLILGTDESRSASVSAGDLNGDGSIDLVIANGRHWPQANKIFINNGFGIFTISKDLDNIEETSYATELADFNNDGYLDIAVGNDMAPNALYRNDGKGNFTKVGSFGIEYAPTRNLLTTDIDSDGDIDILITNRGEVNEICLNNGNGSLDIVIANSRAPNILFLNQENGTKWTPISLADESLATYDIIFTDLNTDGRLDIVESNSDAINRYYFNRGN